MSAPASGRKTPVDYGVQIRFIKDLHDTGGGSAATSQRDGSTKPSARSRYGVAVRVQGIDGQPYVVLKGGEKGDSYGVQLRTQPHYPPPSYNSLPRRREDGAAQGSFSGEGASLRRAQSHSSLLDREASSEDFGDQFRRPPGDGRSGSYGNLDGGIGVGGERERFRGGGGGGGGGEEGGLERTGGSRRAQLNGSSGSEVGREGRGSPLRDDRAPSRSSDQNGADASGPQGSVSRLVGRFGGTGHSPALDARDSGTSPSPSSAPSLTPNTFSSPRSSSPASAYSSLGRRSEAAPKVTTGPAHGNRNDWSSPVNSVAMETPVDSQVPPDLLIDQGQSSGSEFAGEEDQIQQIIYSVLRQGSRESDSAIKHRVSVICDKIQGLKGTQSSRSDVTLKAELEECLDENVQLQEQLGRKKNELHQTHTELTQLRMDRENAESRVRDLEDQLAEFQEELRREADNRRQAETLRTDLTALSAELAEALARSQRQEETLRQRERELTALKGALKDEVATHDREIETLREQYSQDMEKLRATMEQVSQSQAGIEAERQRVNTTVRTLQQQLEESREEGGHWREQFQSTRDELRNTKQELLQARLEKEEFEEELKELQETVTTMKQQIPDPKHADTLNKELERSRVDLKRAQAEADKLKLELDKKAIEIISIRKANQEQEAEQRYDMDRLRDQSLRDREELAKAHEKAKQLAEPSLVEALRGELSDSREEAERLRKQLLQTEEELQTEKDRLSSAHMHARTLTGQRDEVEETNARLKERVTRLESQLQERLSQSSEVEQELQEESRKLRRELEESRRGSTRLSQEREELTSSLEERQRERDALHKENAQLDEQRRQLERSLDKLSKEKEQVSADLRQTADGLQAQLDEQREKWRREQQDSHRNSKEKVIELEKTQSTLHTLQDEFARQKKELFACAEERDNAILDKELITNRLRHLESELETQRTTHNDHSREIRSMEDKVKHLELELDEERSSVEMLTERFTRSRDQIEQLRAELMQERSSKQDIELDKNALERQIKEYKSRVAEMEGHSRSSAGVSQLESKVQELEDRLRTEDREKNMVVSSQRRLERKLKELNITLDEERHQHSEQRDQLALRVKALKRQVDEGEGEMERLEGLRRKAIRDYEEQLEQKDALQTRVTALENELKRKVQQVRRQALDSSALSSEDDEDDGLFDHTSITSILTESNLQTSSC